jgi:hypothetical protein
MATFLKTPSDEGVIHTTANTLPSNPQVGWSVLLSAILGSSLALADALCRWVMIEDMPFKRTSGAVTGERAVDENGLAVRTAQGGLPDSHA